MYSKNPDLTSHEIRETIFSFWHRHVPKYPPPQQLLTVRDLDQLLADRFSSLYSDSEREKTLIVSSRPKGSRCWVIFLEHKEHYYAINFPHHGYHRRDQIQLYPIPIKVAKRTFLGTVLEGTYHADREGNKFLVIDEVHLLAGESILHIPKWERMIHLGRYIQQYMLLETNYRIMIANFYQSNKEQLGSIHRIILDQIDDEIQSIMFWPSFTKRSNGDLIPIWYYQIVDADLNPDVIKTSTMWLRRTKTPDVYDLLQKDTQNKIDLALIPDIHTSSLCKSWFRGKSTKPVLVLCHLDCVRNKWVPVSLAT